MGLVRRMTRYANPATFANLLTASAGVRTSAGSVGTPAYSFADDPDTGIYWPSADGQIAFSVNGSRILLFNASGPVARLDARIILVSTTTPQWSVLYDGSNYVDIGVGATGIVTLNAVGAAAGFVFSDLVTANAGFNAAAGQVYKVNETQVVSAQGVAVADATDAASVITQLNLWLARARAHGLIAA